MSTDRKEAPKWFLPHVFKHNVTAQAGFLVITEIVQCFSFHLLKHGDHNAKLHASLFSQVCLENLYSFLKQII